MKNYLLGIFILSVIYILAALFVVNGESLEFDKRAGIMIGYFSCIFLYSTIYWVTKTT